MPVTNPWLAGPAPRRPRPHDRLEERILNLLSSQNMCVLATTGPAGPLATPVRYFHLDFTLLFTDHLHVVIGLLANVWLIASVRRGLTAYRVTAVRMVAWYWYFVAAITVVFVATQVSPS